MFSVEDAFALEIGRCVALACSCRGILVQVRDHLASRAPGPIGCTHVPHPLMECGELLALIERDLVNLPAPELTAMAEEIRSRHLPSLRGAEVMLKCAWSPMGLTSEGLTSGCAVLTGSDRITTTVSSLTLRVPIPGSVEHVVWELIDGEQLVMLQERLGDARDALVQLGHGVRKRLPVVPGSPGSKRAP